MSTYPHQMMTNHVVPGIWTHLGETLRGRAVLKRQIRLDHGENAPAVARGRAVSARTLHFDERRSFKCRRA